MGLPDDNIFPIVEQDGLQNSACWIPVFWALCVSRWVQCHCVPVGAVLYLHADRCAAMANYRSMTDSSRTKPMIWRVSKVNTCLQNSCCPLTFSPCSDPLWCVSIFSSFVAISSALTRTVSPPFAVQPRRWMDVHLTYYGVCWQICSTTSPTASAVLLLRPVSKNSTRSIQHVVAFGRTTRHFSYFDVGLPDRHSTHSCLECHNSAPWANWWLFRCERRLLLDHVFVLSDMLHNDAVYSRV